MSDRITLEQIQVTSRFRFLKILECRIHAEYGEHTRAEVVGVVNRNEAEAVFVNSMDETVEICGRDNADPQAATVKIMFSGVVGELELKQEGEYATLFLKAVSKTMETDIKQKSRSYQDLSMTYKDVAESVLSEYGAVLSGDGLDRQLEYPLIQYDETDFQFLKRIFSHVQKGITVLDLSQIIRIHAGLCRGKDLGVLNPEQYRYQVMSFGENRPGRRILSYLVEDMDFAVVGDRVQILGKDFYVMEADTGFAQNMLRCDCLLVPAECFAVERIPADTLQKAVLTGRVLETKQELVRLHLDMDREQDASKAYWFPWRPITGNMLYCMPEKGTKAGLYITGGEERTAEVVYNILENGEECSELADPNDRYLTTDHEKRMYLKPSGMGLVNLAENNAQIEIEDGQQLKVKTVNRIFIQAEGQVELKGKRVMVKTPKEVTLVKKDILSPTVVNMCNAFDSIGKIGDFRAASQDIEKKGQKAVPASGQMAGEEPAKESMQEEYRLDEEILETVFANIPEEEMEDPFMKALERSMPLMSRTYAGRTGNG